MDLDILFETYPRSDDGPKLLTVWDMRGSFFVLVTGLSIATVAYLCECLASWSWKNFAGK